jgi:hypothetical protein
MKKIFKLLIVFLISIIFQNTYAETKKLASNDNIFSKIEYQKNVAV